VLGLRARCRVPVEKVTKKKPVQPVKLKNSQLEAVTDDLDLEALNLALKGFASEQLIESVTKAEVERTIDGASTFSLDVSDPERVLMNSPFLAEDVYTEIDGLWFALVGVDKQDDTMSITFEDREVYIMRKYDKPKSAAWGTTTRPKFIRDMVREIKELKIPFVCPELQGAKLIGSSGAATPDAVAQANRAPGFAFGAQVTVKNKIADFGQLDVISRVLRVGLSMNAARKVLLSGLQAITVESLARNLTGGDRDSAGAFQQRPSQGWGTYAQVTNIEHASKSYFERAITNNALHPTYTPGQLAQSVQGSAFPDAYDEWRTEADHTLRTFGISGEDNLTVTSQMTDNNQSIPINVDPETMFLQVGGAGDQFQFTRGQFSTDTAGKQIVKRENTWDSSGRLVDEVGWRRFMVSGSFHLFSEPYLLRSQPRVVIGHEFDEGIIKVDFSYDVGQQNARVTVVALMERWAAPPGSVVLIENMGVINGRWLVNDITRPIFSPIATITLLKPRPRLPEPVQSQSLGALSDITLANATTSNPALASGFISPLPTDPHFERSEFYQVDAEGAPDSAGVRHHAGKDWFAPGGTPVVSPVNGTIVELKPSSGDSGQIFGGTVKIEQTDGYVWVFRHVNPVLAYRVGGRIQAGQTIATVVKWADNPSSSHAHIEVWKTLAGGYNFDNMVDPVAYMKGEPTTWGP
jgi:murein DD-endopeptidase MepM/ murein hydrolase activator NlpD